MDNDARIPADLPPGLHDRLTFALVRLPAAWRVMAVRAQGRDWVVDLADEGGQIGCPAPFASSGPSPAATAVTPSPGAPAQGRGTRNGTRRRYAR